MGYSVGSALECVLLILLTTRVAVSGQTVYFTMDAYTAAIPDDFPDNETIARVYTRTSPNTNTSVLLDLKMLHATHDGAHGGAVMEGNGEGKVQQLFAIEQGTGRIFLQQPIGSRGNITGWNFTLQISAWTRRGRLGDVEPSAEATMRVEIAASPPPCACFRDTHRVFRLKPDAGDGAFGTLRSDPQYLSTNGASFKYSFLSEKNADWLHIDNQTAELVLIRQPSTPLQSVNFTVECVIEKAEGGSNQTRTESTVVLVQVEAIPDYVISVKQNRAKGSHLTWIFSNNPEVMTWETVSVSLGGKHRDFYAFSLTNETSPTVSATRSSGRVIGEIQLLRTMPMCLEGLQTLILYLRDGGRDLTNAGRTTDGHDVSIIVQVEIEAFANETSSVLNLTVHKNASLYSRVATLEFPSSVPQSSKLIDSSMEISLDTGLIRLENSILVVYVGDTTPLKNASLTFVRAVVRGRVECGDGWFLMKWVLQMKIVGQRDVDKTAFCDEATCSRHQTREDCESGCGMGAPDGRCRWRQQRESGPWAQDFSTCSPDFGTCPDGRCEYLEGQHPRLCPQDCIETRSHNMQFMMKLNKNNVGIKSAFGPCWCEDDGLICYCKGPIQKSILSTNTKTTTVGQDVSYALPATTSPSPLITQHVFQCTFCDTLVPVLLFLVLSALAIFVYTRYSRGLPFRRLFSGRNYKPPVIIDSSDSRLNSVLSECSDDGSHLSKGSVTRLKTEFDPKWEFPRRNLVLDKVLGEGEFGRVVRAQALSLRGHTGYTTVAVKMLKGSYSSDDLQDLITEMNLLKDLNHSNVLKLLGASTKKGPLYVIVEYCRHGCLRDFLRRNRQTAVYQDDDFSLQEYDKIYYDDGKTKIVCNNRDLLSFAWQICKGMQYLAMLKLVHRDLAARNILVSEGLVAKVSDFGLARDLYENGTYVKTSKSRIPMKWMAPESLFDNIYTTKTDIWSFGVLFWEIVTMGAMPYPGIASHKLCQLIRQGHRLERPDGCAEELYTIMQQCWQNDPNDRPDFDFVGAMLEQIMVKNSDYLDLSCAPFGDFLDEDDTNSGPSDDKTSSAVPLLQIPASESPELLPLTVTRIKERHDVPDETNLKEIFVEEETNVDAGPLYGDMDPCRLYNNVNNSFITDHLCKTVSEPNLSSTSIFNE